MRFSSYVWSLYKQTDKGAETIHSWIPSPVFPNDKYSVEADETLIVTLKDKNLSHYAQELKLNWYQLVFDYFKSKNDFFADDAKNIYQRWITEGVIINNFTVFEKEDYRK